MDKLQKLANVFIQMVGVLWHMNICGLFDTKSLYIYIYIYIYIYVCVCKSEKFIANFIFKQVVREYLFAQC